MFQIMGSEKRCNVIIRSNDWLCDLFLNMVCSYQIDAIIHNEFYLTLDIPISDILSSLQNNWQRFVIIPSKMNDTKFEDRYISKDLKEWIYKISNFLGG